MNPNAWLERIAPRLNDVWRGAWKAGVVEPGRYLYDHELVIVSKGGCRVQIDDATHDMDAGSFLIVPPGRLHATTTGTHGVERLCVHFDWIRERPRRAEQPTPWIFHPKRPRPADLKQPPSFVPRGLFSGRFDPDGPILPLLTSVVRLWRTGQALDRAAGGAVFGEVLLRLLWRKQPRAEPGDHTSRLAYEVKELLDRNRSDNTPIQTLLPTLGFSYAHLCRVFTAKFGISPVRYRNAARLEKARNMLRNPLCTVAEAAYATGFNDPAYFSRKFHEANGTAPSRSR